MTTTAVPPTSTQLCGVFADVNAAVAAAREAFLAFSDCSLAQRRTFINAVREAASQQERLEYMATAAVEETGMGNAHHKVLKNLYAATRTPGVEDLVMEARQGDDGLTTLEYSPYGVIGAITPTTNPTETIICNTVGMLAAGNTVVFSPIREPVISAHGSLTFSIARWSRQGLPTTSSLSSLSRLQTPPKLSSTTPTSRCL